MRGLIAVAVAICVPLSCRTIEPLGPAQTYHLSGSVTVVPAVPETSDAVIRVYRGLGSGDKPLAQAGITSTGTYELSFSEQCRPDTRFVITATAIGYRAAPAYVECGAGSMVVDFVLARV